LKHRVPPRPIIQRFMELTGASDNRAGAIHGAANLKPRCNQVEAGAVTPEETKPTRQSGSFKCWIATLLRGGDDGVAGGGGEANGQLL
jgi:hypothetical protein